MLVDSIMDFEEYMIISNKQGCFGFESKHCRWFQTLYETVLNEIEVIGNIYDNKELLE